MPGFSLLVWAGGRPHQGGALGSSAGHDPQPTSPVSSGYQGLPHLSPDQGLCPDGVMEICVKPVRKDLHQGQRREGGRERRWLGGGAERGLGLQVAGKEQRGSDTCGLNPWEGGVSGEEEDSETNPGLLAKPPPSTEDSVTRPSSHPYVRALLTFPPDSDPGVSQRSRLPRGGRSSLSVPLAHGTRQFGVKGDGCARVPPHMSCACLCLKHLLLFTMLSYLVLSSDASFLTSKESSLTEEGKTGPPGLELAWALGWR